ncbi:MAG TPA: 16S rRNA (uracil(1498)-N(3))-methyltransferase [Burkholderiaceae bacterium]|jgi:16S rRNA (uracil1498-N3)-methyltransferase|nr:16S rRNA (uracil(1498)-N(3))-methyltransferase [Burkholderiaceae bacterium]
MSLRLFVDSPLSADLEFALPEDAARHVQVRRLQPGDALHLFDGRGGEWSAQVTRMGKRDVDVRVGAHEAVERELPFRLEIALGMPTNERMDALVEKATELGAAAIQPLQTERSVLRLDGERAAKRVAHWQAVAVGASEQSGRTRVPVIAPVRSVAAWLAALPDDDEAGRFVMSTGSAPALARVAAPAAAGRWLALSGPEGGLAPEEEAAAVARGFARISLGPLILRADTAPLAWLAQMAVLLPCAQ